MIPILFSAAGRAPGAEPGTAIAAVATAADWAGIGVGLGVVSLLCSAIALGARTVDAR